MVIQAIARSDIPKRTDREPAPPLSESKVVLYGTQGGNCNGCGTHFLPQHLTVDHIIARSKGGTGHLEQLAAALWALQLVEGGSSDGVFAGAVGEGCLSGWVGIGVIVTRRLSGEIYAISKDTAVTERSKCSLV